MLTSLLITLSVAVAILALLDLFLSDAQKKWLAVVATIIWSILDEAKAWSFSEWLKNPRATWWFAVSLALFSAIFGTWTELYGERSGDQNPMIVTIGQALSGIFLVTVSRPLFGIIFRFKSKKELARRGCLASLLSLAGLILAGLIIALFESAPELPPLTEPYSRAQTIASLLFIASSLLFACMLTLCLSVALAYIASLLLFIGEFFVRRIAEYPKGPVLALSAFFGSVFALLKAFSGR